MSVLICTNVAKAGQFKGQVYITNATQPSVNLMACSGTKLSFEQQIQSMIGQGSTVTCIEPVHIGPGGAETASAKSGEMSLTSDVVIFAMPALELLSNALSHQGKSANFVACIVDYDITSIEFTADGTYDGFVNRHKEGLTWQSSANNGQGNPTSLTEDPIGTWTIHQNPPPHCSGCQYAMWGTCDKKTGVCGTIKVTANNGFKCTVNKIQLYTGNNHAYADVYVRVSGGNLPK